MNMIDMLSGIDNVIKRHPLIIIILFGKNEYTIIQN